MRSFLIYLLTFAPFLIYNLICFYSNVGNSKIDRMQIIISGLLALLGYVLAQRIIKKTKK